MSETEAQRADRERGDHEGDALVREMLGEDEHQLDGRLGYNHLLDIADVLVESPELAFAPGSEVRRQLERYRSIDHQLTGFFDPVEAPEWLDEAKLARAARLWEAHSLSAIGVLYAASLPTCYLIKNGIPALYETGKLADKQFIFQRIYETGLMLDAVMRPGGLAVSHDIDHAADAHLEAAVHAAGGGDRMIWQAHKLHAEDGCTVDHQRVAEELTRRVEPRRFLWGAGFVATRKVRLLHASMRFMLQHPERFVPAAVQDDKSLAHGLLANLRKDGWPREELGVPVNQEDLAYTLLTFGLVIPEGLERWHLPLDDADREAFLHLWRVVGWVLGIEDRLLPTSWADARRIRDEIAARQVAGSPMGKAMTRVLMGYLQDYLPTTWGLRESLPAWLIRDQMGEQAALVLDEDALRASRAWRVRLIGAGMHLGLWLGFRLRRTLGLLPGMRSLVTVTLAEVSRELIASWKGTYRRRPFYIPDDATTWKRKRGVNVPYLRTLMAWRRRLFRTIAIGLALGILGMATAAVGLIAWPLEQTWWTGCVLTGIGILLLAHLTLSRWVPAVARSRPQLEDQALCVVA